MAEWLRQGPAKPCTRVRFPPPPRAISSVGERYLDTVEATGSIPVSPTSTNTVVDHDLPGNWKRIGSRLVNHRGSASAQSADVWRMRSSLSLRRAWASVWWEHAAHCCSQVPEVNSGVGRPLPDSSAVEFGESGALGHPRPATPHLPAKTPPHPVCAQTRSRLTREGQ